MLLDIRETVRGSKPLKYTLITIICIPFVFFGVSSYFSGGGPSYVAKVGGEEIGAREFEQAYNQQRLRLQQMFGGNLPESFANEGILRQQALESLVTQQVLRNTVAENKFSVSDQTLARTIQELPNFQADGVFDKDMYRRQIQSMGMSIDQFENSFRNDTALSQFRSGIVDTSFVLPSEKDRVTSLEQQIRKTDYVRMDLVAASDGIEVADSDISEWFESHADDYKFPERVKIQYLELSRDLLSADIDVSDEDATAYYEDNRNSYMAAEERKASHILLEVDGDDDLSAKTEQMNEIKARLEGGEEFSALASEFSADVGSASQGGSLGQFGRGAMVPEFDAAVFAMTEIGALSEPVKTDFGLHLIKLDEIIEERGKPFDEVKTQVINTLKREKADAEFLELNEVLIEQAFDNSDSLEPAATSTGLEIVTTDWIDEDLQGDPILSNPQILASALSDDVLVEGNNSEPLALGERHLIVLRVLEHEDQRPKTLEDVSDEIKEQLITDRAGAKLDESISSLVAVVDEGGDLEAAAAEAEAVFTDGEEFTRTSTVLDRSVVSELFELPHPAADSPVTKTATLGNGDRVLLVLREIVIPEKTEEPAAEGEIAEEAPDPRVGNAEFTALLESLRDAADVEVNEQVISGAESGSGY